MTETNRVLWSEGLFLRTQHFQQQDRFFEGTVRGALQAGKSTRGASVITFSGQVAAQSPHWTQALSEKYSAGWSSLSESAPVGQADTHERQSVQPSTSNSSPPNGAAAGNTTLSTGVGAARCSSVIVLLKRLRLSPNGRKVAGFLSFAPGLTWSSAALRISGSSASITPQISAP